MSLNQKQIDNIMSLSGDKRYQHFLKVVADWEEVWGLYDNGWALSETDDKEVVFPVWPAKEYAELCVKNEWSGYKVVSFSLDELINDLIPSLKNDAVLLGVFCTPDSESVVVSGEQLLTDLDQELEKY
jgi:hypothetical protein